MAEEVREGDKVFLDIEITNFQIYNKLLEVEKTSNDTLAQATKTNGRVNAIEQQLKEEICPQIDELQTKSIIMFISKFKAIMIILIVVGALFAGTKLDDLIAAIK